MLRLLREGGIHSTAELARRLGVGKELARLMVEDLARRGYLATLQTDCASACEGCALAGACGTAAAQAGAPALLALSAKGRQAIRSG